MAVLQILKMGHPILRKKASKVKNFEDVSELILNMKDTLQFIGASGLAAPQVMVSKRVILSGNKETLIAFSNNLKSEKNPFWIGSRICVKKYLKSPQWLRDLKFKKRPFWRIDKLRLNNIIENGGWHFCNIKTPQELLHKYRNLCETNDPYHFKEKINEIHLSVEEIKKKIDLQKDIIGRNDNFKKIPIDSTYPKFILSNLNNLKDWIA